MKVIMLSPEIRTVAYDRAGTGKSETGPLPQTMAQNAFELHELLKAVKINSPVILVGQSKRCASSSFVFGRRKSLKKRYVYCYL